MDPDAQARVLAVARTSPPSLKLRAAPYGSPLELDAPGPGEELRLQLFAYPRSLEGLGLVAGPLEADAGCARGCELLDPLWTHEARVGASGVLEGWRPAAPDPGVKEALVADFATRCDRCAPDRLETLPLPGPVLETTTAFLAPAPDSIYVGLYSGEIFHIGPELDARRLCEAGYTSYRLRAGVLRGEILWILDSLGLRRLAVPAQDPSSPCAVQTATVPGERTTELRHMVGAPEDAPFELFLLSEAGELHRYDGQSWTDLVRLEVEPDPNLSLTWLSPGRVAVGLGDDRVAMVQGASVEILRVPVRQASVRAQVYEPGLGHVFLLRDHGLAIFDGDTWRTEDEIPEGWLNARALIAAEGGLLYTMAVGRFGRWFPERGYCPLQDGFGSEIVTGMARLGDHVLFDRISDGSRFGPRVGAVSKPVSRCESR